jgi:chromosome segregation protein
MRLRRVVIHGFKTFADRTEIRFEPGITAVVGANGSGKSNLVDAVRWALGETSARELRGTRFDEVIFAGGQGRPRMGVADVDLVLDNEDGRMAVEDAEVCLSRRVVRGGEVEYRINGQRARLRDLERLLSTTGLTQHGYAVVAQHDIEAIIEASPRQRRALVEQAAGVREVRTACDDALRRLEQVDAAVVRLAERLGEAEPRLAELAVEAEVAREQRGLAERLAELRGSLAREEWRAARAQSRQAHRRLEAAERRLEAARAAEAAFSERLDSERLAVDEARAAQRAAADRLEAARVAAERAEGEARRFSDRARSGVLQRAGARAQLAAATAEAEAAAAAEAALPAEGERAEELRRRGEELDRLGREMEEARREAAAAAARLAEAERAAAGAAALGVSAAAAARAAEAERQAAEEALDVATRELAEAEARAAAAGEAVSAAEAALGAAQAAARTVEAASKSAAAGQRSARDELRAAEGAVAARRDAAAAARARAAELRGAAAGALGGDGVLATRAAELGGVRLVDCLRVRDPADAAAVEAALEADLGAWVVADLAAAAALLQGAEKREEALAADIADTGAAAVSPPAEVPEALRSRGVRPVLEAVEVEPRAVAAILHCLSSAWLAPDPDTAGTAVAALGGRAVLPDGTVITRAGVRAGGRPQALALVADARAADARAATAARATEEGEAALRVATRRVADADAAATLAGERLAAARHTLAEAGATLAAARAAASAEEGRRQSLGVALERRREVAARAASAAAGAAAELARVEERAGAARTEAEACREGESSARRRRDGLEARWAAAEARVQELARGAREAERRRHDAAQRSRAAAERIADAAARVAQAEEEVLLALARGHAAALAAEGAGRGVDAAGDALLRASGPLAEAEARLGALDAERSEVRVAVARAEDEVNAARSEFEVAELRVAELAESVREELDDEEPALDPAAAERTEREITRLERRIGSLGLVNGLAPEQHAVLAERVAALRADHDDLVVAGREVRHLAQRLGVEAGRRFDAVFGAVGANFTELFTELFGGGRAALRLEEPAQPPAPTEPSGSPPAGSGEEEIQGVEILAQPPGKRLQPLTHLSGGERALTALAMVLALQQVNPSPFYIFDEVDAPLDDSSVGRFTRLLTRLAGSQQFILVTHNHLTMAAADCLWGVTSDREGVSSVVSVRFLERAREVEALGLLQAPLRRAAL